MAKYISRRDFLKGTAAGALGAVLAGMHLSAFAEEKGIYTPGTYSATAAGIESDVTVTMTFDANSIKEVLVDVSGETEGIGAAIGDTMVERVLAAQSGEIDAVSGASITSAAVKSAVNACIAQAKGESVQVAVEKEPTEINARSTCASWLGEAPVIDDSQITETITCDVLVLGGGHAGTQCAKEAAKAGKKVAVIESQAEDTIFYYGEDVGTFNSDYVVNTLGYGPYDVQDVVAEFMKVSGYHAQPEIIKKYVENSGPMIDDFLKIVREKNPSLLEHMNVQLCSDAYWKDKSQPCDMGAFKSYVGTYCFRSEILDEIAEGVGAYSTLGPCEKLSREYAIEHGAAWYNEHFATVLTMDGKKVTGAIVKDTKNGTYKKFLANTGVVIAMGAFQANPKMVAQYFREAVELQAFRGVDITSGDAGTGRDSGYGHRLGCWAGGRMEAGPYASLANVSGPGPFGFAPTLQLNCRGERFMNEGDFNAMANRINRQPLGIYCNVFDGKWREYLNFCGTNHGGVDFGVPEYVAQWEEDMKHVVDAGAKGYVVRHGCLTERADMQQTPVYGANTLEELAGYLGYEGEAVERFVASVEHYNELCRAGVDTDFGKKADFMVPLDTAPYYGSVASNTTTAGIAVTLGGLVTDSNMQVLGDDDEPIDSLFAVGNCLGGRYALTYPGVLAGNSIGMAMTNGYCVGKYLGEK